MWSQACVTLLLLIYTKDSLSDNLEICGRPEPHLKPRIMGGKDATHGAWPWMASLHKNGRHICGGSLINKEWVLTAAHCVKGKDKKELRVHLGKWRQKEKSITEVQREVKNIYPHLDFKELNYNYDIALLHLSSPVDFTDYIKPMCLADDGSEFPKDTPSTVIGWGRIGVTVNKDKTTAFVPLPDPKTLQKVDVLVYENADCKLKCKYITENMICTGTPAGGKGPYRGDSGGPLMSQQCSVWVQSGVVGGGIGCAPPGPAADYARVSKYKKWIIDTINNKDDLPGFVFFGPSVKCPETQTQASCLTNCLNKIKSLLGGCCVG